MINYAIHSLSYQSFFLLLLELQNLLVAGLAIRIIFFICLRFCLFQDVFGCFVAFQHLVAIEVEIPFLLIQMIDEHALSMDQSQQTRLKFHIIEYSNVTFEKLLVQYRRHEAWHDFLLKVINLRSINIYTKLQSLFCYLIFLFAIFRINQMAMQLFSTNYDLRNVVFVLLNNIIVRKTVAIVCVIQQIVHYIQVAFLRLQDGEDLIFRYLN